MARKDGLISVQWKAVRFCGLDIILDKDAVQYILEVAEGHEWRGGMVSKYVSEGSFADYHLMCRGSSLLQAEVEDLKPATWYHWRLSIEYMGIRVSSETKHIPTLCSRPSPPSRPRVQVILGAKSMQSKIGVSATKVKFTWIPPASNGSGIEKYHVQLQEVIKLNKDEIEIGPTGGWVAEEGFAVDDKSDQVLVKKWQTVYCNLYNEAILSAPLPGRIEWRIRLRAKNSEGWSAFGPVLSINIRSHPSLFLSSTSGLGSSSSTTGNSSALPDVILSRSLGNAIGTSDGRKSNFNDGRIQSPLMRKTMTEELEPLRAKPQVRGRAEVLQLDTAEQEVQAKKKVHYSNDASRSSNALRQKEAGASASANHSNVHKNHLHSEQKAQLENTSNSKASKRTSYDSSVRAEAKDGTDAARLDKALRLSADKLEDVQGTGAEGPSRARARTASGVRDKPAPFNRELSTPSVGGAEEEVDFNPQETYIEEEVER